MDWTHLAKWVNGVKETELPKPPIPLTSAIRIQDVGRYLAALRDEVAKGADTVRARTGVLQREIRLLMELARDLPERADDEPQAETVAAPPVSEPDPVIASPPPAVEPKVEPKAEPLVSPAPVREPKRAPAVSESAALADPVIIAFDFETTGLYPNESDIVEVGGVKFTPMGEIIDRFERFADPGYPIPPDSTAVSGITTEMVAGAEPPLTVLEAFIAWAGSNAVYVAHNASFDAGFLEATFEKARKKCPPLQIVDTLVWARSLGLKLQNYKLGTLLAYYHKNTEGLHRSMADAQGVMELVLQFVTGHLTPLEEVMRWAKPLPLPGTRR